MFHGIKLPWCRNVPLALTSPCAEQSVHPGQRTQTNSTGKIRLCEIPGSLDLLHVPSSIYKPWGCQGQGRLSLAHTHRAGGLSCGRMGLGLAPGAGCHHPKMRGLKGFLLKAQLQGLLFPLTGGERQTEVPAWTNLLMKEQEGHAGLLGLGCSGFLNKQ